MTNKIKKIATTATEGLKNLWEEGIFKTWKSKSAIDKHFEKNGYHFTTPELGMALKRAKYLTRRGNRTNYEYIQKYPYVAEKHK